MINGMPRSALFAFVALALSCNQTPTSVLLAVEAAPGLPAIDQLSLNVYDDQGVVVDGRRLPREGEPELPSSVVLFPDRDQGELRILVRGLHDTDVVGEGTTRVTLKKGQQVRATVTVSSGRLPDRDSDGVPDEIDNCPDYINATQGPCDVDGGLDLGDGPPLDVQPTDADLGPDLPQPDLNCDVDKDSYLSAACGGDDCDDSEPKANPGATEGPAGSASCSDGLDNDCDGDADGDDSDCIACTSDGECSDGTICTTDTCVSGQCVHSATNEGKPCSDNLCATATKCAAGKCDGKPKVCPTSNDCKVATCTVDVGCGEVDKPDGTACSDTDPCTTNETCQSGSCVAPTQSPSCYVDGTCYDDGDKPDACRVCDTAKSQTAWTILSSYCYISGVCRADGYTSGTCRTCDTSASQTSWTIKSGYCYIGGTCYQSGASGSGCDVCDPTQSATSWSAKTDCGIVLVALNEGHTGNLGGLSGANSLCQTQATAAKLTGTYKAFLSTSTQDVVSLIPSAQASLPVYNSKAEQLYSSWTSVFGGSGWPGSVTIYSFDGKAVDEGTGASPAWNDADCWHGSTSAGLVSTGNTCTDWTATTGSGAGGEIDMNQMMTPGETNLCTLYQAVICVRIP